jgi:hypothetical protein
MIVIDKSALDDEQTCHHDGIAMPQFTCLEIHSHIHKINLILFSISSLSFNEVNLHR